MTQAATHTVFVVNDDDLVGAATLMASSFSVAGEKPKLALDERWTTTGCASDLDVRDRQASVAGVQNLAREFLVQARPIIDAPWRQAAIPDFLDPLTCGERPALRVHLNSAQQSQKVRTVMRSTNS